MRPDESVSTGLAREVATSSAATSSTVAPTQAEPAPPSPAPVSVPTSAPTAPAVGATNAVTLASNTPEAPQTADASPLLLLGGGAALAALAFAAWQITRSNTKKEKKSNRCAPLKAKLITQEKVVETLKEKLKEEAIDTASKHILTKEMQEAKKVYDDLVDTYEKAKILLEKLKADYEMCIQEFPTIDVQGRKVVKFRDTLAEMILAGKKDATWRLFDDKNLREGDEVDFVNWNTGEKFGEAELVKVWEKKMGELEPRDFDGHEKFESEEDMYQHYRTYYGDKVGPDTVVKIIKFKFRHR